MAPATGAMASRFAALELARIRFQACYAGLSREDLGRAPASGAWSVLQVLEHLVIAEEGTVRDLARPGDPDAHVTVRSRLILWLIYGVFLFRVKVRVPSRRLAPGGSATLEDLERRWTAARAALGEHLQGMTPADRRQARFRHPVAGWLTLGTGLQFLARHIEHHGRQVGRIRAAIGR